MAWLRFFLLFACVSAYSSAGLAQDAAAIADGYDLDIIQRVLADDDVFKLTMNLSDQSVEEDAAARKEFLASDDALAAMAWLSSYSSTRAKSDPSELKRFSEQLQSLPSATVKLIFARLNMERESIRQRSETMQRLRREASERTLRMANQRPTAPFSRNRGASLSRYFDNGPYPRTTSQSRRVAYAVPPPIVSARGFARAAVYRSYFGW